MKKRVLYICSLLCAVALGAGGVLLWQKLNAPTDSGGLVELNATPKPSNDISVPTASALKEQYQGDPAQYEQLMNAGELKSFYKRYDEAKTYFEAALSVVDPVDTDRLATTRYRLYLLADVMSDAASKDYYKKLLGDDYISKQEAIRNEQQT